MNNINWYPGHMKKTKDLLKENLKLIDLVIEVIDARIPISSKNPDFDLLFKNKERLIILNKYDLSDPLFNESWINYYKKNNYSVILYNATNNKEIKKLETAISKSVQKIHDRYKSKGIKNRTIKAIIVGIPNSGKSTLINSIARKKSAKTGNKPGVTRGKQWIRLTGNIDLLDTPGILWPKIANEESGLNLAFTGAIRDEILDIEEIAIKLVNKIKLINESVLANRYKIDILESDIDNIRNIAIKRGCLIKGGDIDWLRVSKLVIDDFRKGHLGKITLEKPI